MSFGQHVTNLVEVMEEIGNPFLEETTDLLRLDTRYIMDPAVSAVCHAEEMGQQQYRAFMTDRLLDVRNHQEEQTSPLQSTTSKREVQSQSVSFLPEE